MKLEEGKQFPVRQKQQAIPQAPQKHQAVPQKQQVVHQKHQMVPRKHPAVARNQQMISPTAPPQTGQGISTKRTPWTARPAPPPQAGRGMPTRQTPSTWQSGRTPQARPAPQNRAVAAPPPTWPGETGNGRKASVSQQKQLYYKKQWQRSNLILFICFMAVLSLVGLLFLVTPKEELAQNEKRALAQMPELRWQKIMDGSFPRDFEAFYADQFPGRKWLIHLDQSVKRAMQALGLADDVQMISARKDSGGKGDQISLETTAPTGSPSQESQMSTAAETTKATELMAPPPKSGNLQEPEYESSSIIISQGRAMEVFYYHRPSGMAYAERLNALRVALPADIRLISMLVPTSIAFYGPDKIRSGINSEYDAIHSIYEREDAGIIKVDAFSQLSQHAQDNLYFRTDHHWNGQGAYYGYVAFCQALGLEAQPLSEMTLTQPDHHFLGSLYGYTDNSPLLIGSEDRAEIYLPRETGEIKWYSDASMVDPQPGVLLNADFPQDNQYLLFSGGDVPLTVIESSQKNGRKICVVKDSYGNALVPYLMNDYQEIYIIDPRQFSDPLIPFLKEKGINDLMILNYSFAISNPSWLNGFDLISGYTEE